MKRFCIWCAMGMIVIGSSGCASLGTFNPATGRNELLLISTYQEVALGQEVHQTLSEQYQLSTDSAKNARLQRLGQQMASVSDRQDYQYTFFLVDEDQLNAFTTPGGRIYVFTGLMDRLTDEQLASVLAHEIGHCAAKHTAKKYQSALGYNLIGSLVLGQIASDSARQLASISSGAIMQLVSSSYSRRDEYEADRLAVKYMQRAGYDPKAVIGAFEVLKANSGGSQIPLILRSHPYLDDRITAVKQQIATGSVQP